MNPAQAHLSSLELDTLALDALPPPEKERMAAHLGTCATCRQRSEENAALKAHFTRHVLPHHLADPRWRPSPWARWGALFARVAPVLAVAGLAVFFVLPRESVHEAPDLAVKGGATLQVFVHRDERVWKAGEGEPLAPMDQIRFQVESGGLPYLMVVSIDGAGKPSIYYPFNGLKSGPVETGEAVALPYSIILDAAPGPERLFALFSREPLQATTVRAALEEIGSGGPAAIRASTRLFVEADDQASFLFEKATP
ncbi:DUF4384 domain-containing protein [Archangium lipolyticum]|uniref:DUF4384 domain-containing protein n=1 Tax=Archangium lipolyticum TaxID=2970465 RepID=UPI002149B71C|nr:DUF4384 domain-containing protein [Archangium lipolyticum]